MECGTKRKQKTIRYYFLYQIMVRKEKSSTKRTNKGDQILFFKEKWMEEKRKVGLKTLVLDLMYYFWGT